jgi:hypothetical protein
VEPERLIENPRDIVEAEKEKAGDTRITGLASTRNV